MHNEGFLAMCLCSLHQAATLLSLSKLWTLAWDGLHEQPGRAARDLHGSLEEGWLGQKEVALPLRGTYLVICGVWLWCRQRA